VVSEGESAAGNIFTAQSEAKLRFHRLMDNLFNKSEALLSPVLEGRPDAERGSDLTASASVSRF
jgi:hypothetical protein